MGGLEPIQAALDCVFRVAIPAAGDESAHAGFGIAACLHWLGERQTKTFQGVLCIVGGPHVAHGWSCSADDGIDVGDVEFVEIGHGDVGDRLCLESILDRGGGFLLPLLEFDLLFLNWGFLGLSLEPFGFDIGLSSVYYDDKDNFDKGKLHLRPSLGLSVGLSDLSFSKNFPFSFNIHYGIRYLFPSMKFYDNSKFSTITSEPSLTLNLKIPFEISVPSKKL